MSNGMKEGNRPVLEWFLFLPSLKGSALYIVALMEQGNKIKSEKRKGVPTNDLK